MWTIVNVVFCLIPLALMAVLVKVSQLHFVTNGTPWTLQDYWTFVFFINAMAGLRGDIETVALICSASESTSLKSTIDISMVVNERDTKNNTEMTLLNVNDAFACIRTF